MQITRKSFLSTAAAATVALVFRPAELLADTAGTSGRNPLLRLAVGETFYAEGGNDVRVPLLLERAEDRRGDPATDQFTLTFSGEEGSSLVEGTWKLTAASGTGVYDVFLVPAGSAKGRLLYRADFCLLKSSSQASARR